MHQSATADEPLVCRCILNGDLNHISTGINRSCQAGGSNCYVPYALRKTPEAPVVNAMLSEGRFLLLLDGPDFDATIASIRHALCYFYGRVNIVSFNEEKAADLVSGGDIGPLGGKCFAIP